jgi:hypothetical protein
MVKLRFLLSNTLPEPFCLAAGRKLANPTPINKKRLDYRLDGNTIVSQLTFSARCLCRLGCSRSDLRIAPVLLFCMVYNGEKIWRPLSRPVHAYLTPGLFIISHLDPVRWSSCRCRR